MRHLLSLVCAALAAGPLAAGDEQERYEEQATTRCANQQAERSMRAERGERAQWLRDLEAAYPGKVPAPKADGDDAPAWFDLLAGNGDEWRRVNATAAGVGPLFERVVNRMELGPVPTIKRDEFLRYAKLLGRNLPQGGGADPDHTNDADKAFRVLDLNADGELTGDELTSALRQQKGQVDANGNGRISKEEYRDYFKRRVDAKAEALATAYKANDKLMRGLYGNGVIARGPGAIPEWFTTLDTDKDKQISLFEWRKGGRTIASFQEMDLNGDGLLTRDEYARYMKLKAAAEPKVAPDPDPDKEPFGP